jgi:hypothetical protein
MDIQLEIRVNSLISPCLTTGTYARRCDPFGATSVKLVKHTLTTSIFLHLGKVGECNIYSNNEGWWFWSDQLDMNVGPYTTKENAELSLIAYLGR